MKRRVVMPRYLLPLFPLALIACDDDPVALTGCDAPHGCEVEGFDLAILDATLLFDADQPHHAQVGGNVVDPGDDVTVHFRIVNRGTEPAPVARLAVTSSRAAGVLLMRVPIPALSPGEEYSREADFPTPALALFSEMLYDVQLTLATDTTGWFDDAVTENNFTDGKTPLRYHPRVPILRVEFSDVPDSVHALHPYVLGARITNLSPFVAVDDLSFGLCAWDGGNGCDPGPDGPWSTSGSISVGDDRIVAAGLLPPQDWGVDLNHPWADILINACFTPSPTAEGWERRLCVPTSQRVVVKANLAAACPDAPILIPPTTFASLEPNANCDLWAAGIFFPVHAFDAQAGEQFRFTAQDSVTARATLLDIYDVEAAFLDGSHLNAPRLFTAPETGRYFLFTFSIGAPSGPILFERL